MSNKKQKRKRIAKEKQQKIKTWELGQNLLWPLFDKQIVLNRVLHNNSVIAPIFNNTCIYRSMFGLAYSSLSTFVRLLGRTYENSL